jgi:hypothetical protein
MGLFDRFFGKKNNAKSKKNNQNMKNKNNSSKSNQNVKNKKSKKKSKKKRSNSISLRSKNSNQYSKLEKNEYNLSEFQNLFSNSDPKFMRVVKADLVIMYDPDAPHGEEMKNNKTYIHYLQVKDDVVLPYQPPNPPKGTHNYHIYSLKCRNKKVKELLREIGNTQDRKPEILQNLHKDAMIGKWKVQSEYIIRNTHFKVKQNQKKN